MNNFYNFLLKSIFRNTKNNLVKAQILIEYIHNLQKCEPSP